MTSTGTSTGTTLEIGRLHARYAADVASQAGTLDAALKRLAEDALAGHVERVALPDDFAVCVPDVTVPVRLDPSRPLASTTRAWAAAIVDAVRQRLDAGQGIVVYRRQLDVLLDVVRRTAVGDWSMVWAWRQADVVAPAFPGPAPHGRAVADVLAGHPDLVPAVLSRVAPDARRVLDAADWVRLARVVRREAGAPGSVSAAGERAGDARGASPSTVLVPAEVWSRVAAPEDRWDLAVLTLVMAEPARCREAAAVARMLRGEGPGTTSGPRLATTGRAAPSQADPGSDALPAEPTGTDEAESPDAHPEPQVSEWGGVLYCIHAVTALRLVEELTEAEPATTPVSLVLARVLAAVAGTGVDDPAVLAAAGWHGPLPLPEPPDSLDPEERATCELMANRIRAWTARQLDPGLDPGLDEPREADLTWVWRRPVTLHSEPGWLEATFPLSSVDLRLRLAGLDLDPGPVWWLGGVVRFRHV